MTDRDDGTAREAQKKRAARIHAEIERLTHSGDTSIVLPAPVSNDEEGTSPPARPDYRAFIEQKMRRDQVSNDPDRADDPI